MRLDRSERTPRDCEVIIRVINDEIPKTHYQQVNLLLDSRNDKLRFLEKSAA